MKNNLIEEYFVIVQSLFENKKTALFAMEGARLL
jgi:hypothetical protein